MAFEFEELEIWKAAIDISDDVNKLTRLFQRMKIRVNLSNEKSER